MREKMRLWKRASGALKDRNSLLVASLARRTALRNRDIEAAVIKSTSHDDSRVDYRNAQRVYSWIRMSPAYYFQPFASALNARMSKTRSWVVALKGLMLMHGVVCCRVPAVQKVPRLPFDLSSFCDGHLPFAKSWPYNAFIRAYYAYLDQRSAFTSVDLQEREARSRLGREAPIVWDLRRLQRLQGLLDTLLEIKPQTEGRIELVVLEAMDCIVIEIYDIYSRICNGVAKVLVRICSAEKGEAAVTLKVLQKSIFQGEQLSSFFEYCKGIGVLNASECPKVERVPEEDIRELQRMIMDPPEEKAIIVSETRVDSVTGVLQTVITANWEVFDEDSAKAGAKIDSAAGALIPVPADQQRSKALNGHHHHQELPDLISF
ncbi:putative clathrin assembly protein At1g25240 [Diospyros lotus]|uniref:putative clathrin assembly protein At1g25240 n=1 Tax=Diospyros lotus TaxID=55363 RepID=UPI00225A1C94|nr:putative clathrin assembly protein At1g25240 [Diospyros lotus]